MQHDGVLFLDIDGVLNSINHYKKFRPLKLLEKDRVKNCRLDINPLNVKALNIILKHCNLGIVLSSTQRKIDFLREALFDVGIDKYKDRILGYTKSIGDRGEEIKSWIDENNLSLPFIIIDDKVCDMGEMLPYCVHVKGGIHKNGMTREHVKKAIDLFEMKLHCA